jgi:predicted alpha/beta hydrolase family esterase
MQTAASEKPRIVYIHGDGVSNWRWGWVVRVERDLRAAGFPTFFELFPDSIEARAEYWLPFLSDHVQAGERDVLLGWSCGSVAALRYAQEHRVRGLVLVAPYYTDLGLEGVRRSGFVDAAAWDWSQIKSHAERIAIFHSDRDPYIPQAEFAELSRWLAADSFEFRGAGHFAEQDSFPELSEYIARTYA